MSNGKKEKIHSYSNSTDDYIHKIQKNDVNLREDSVALNGGLFSLLNVPRKIARLRVSFFWLSINWLLESLVGSIYSICRPAKK